MKNLALVLITTLLFNCSQEATVDTSDDIILDSNLIKSSAAYNSSISQRENGSQHPFSIEFVERNAQTLTVAVKGGCSPSSFTFVWDGRLAESFPMQAWILLKHNESTETCSHNATFMLTLDLSKLPLSTNDLNNCTFHIANASIRQDISIDPNGVVSRK